MHNVFEHFEDIDKQHTLWKFVLQTLKSSCLLFAIPSLQESLEKVDVSL